MINAFSLLCFQDSQCGTVIDVNIECAVKLVGTNCILYPVNSKDLQHIWVRMQPKYMWEPGLGGLEGCFCTSSNTCKGSIHIVQDASAVWFYFKLSTSILPGRRWCSITSSPHLFCISDHIAETKLTWRARLTLNWVRTSALRWAGVTTQLGHPHGSGKELSSCNIVTI